MSHNQSKSTDGEGSPEKRFPYGPPMFDLTRPIKIF